jgi:signal transduction histidine kinase/DNA-binding response OmpR family regulator
MARLSIARSLLVALAGLTLALAVVAALSVSSLSQARQDYEDELNRAYSVEVSTANLLAAGVVEETVLRSRRSRPADRDRAAAVFDQATAAARRAARGDAGSLRLVDTVVAAERRARDRPSPRALATAFTAARGAAAELASRQTARRATAHRRASDRTRQASIFTALAGGFAVVAALAIVGLLVSGLRRPLEDLVGATRRLAEGDLEARVEPAGPSELRQLSTAFNSMAGDLDTARQRIEAGRRRLATVIESLGDALVIVDSSGRIVETNPRAADLVPELLPGQPADGFLPVVEEALEHEVQVSHGERVLSVTAARMAPDGIVWTIRDATERARLERAKSEFVATASHELRSPLTSIKGFVELLSAGELPVRQREFVDVILLSTNRLVELVNDLLDVARVEAGQLDIQRRPIAVGEAIEEVAALMRARLDAKHQTLEVDIAPAISPADADPARVRQIVTNLLTNAHLYTPEGGRIVIRGGAQGEQVVISVSDTGRGMSEAQLERLFERFYRGEGTPTAPGTGLGMSIVKSLVDLHHGEIDTIRLPRAHVTDVSEPRELIRGKRVLVIDDEPEVARLIAEQLRPYAVDVVCVASAAAAIAELRSSEFDAMTLDILLGDANGFEVLQTLREDPDLRNVPVIVVSVLAGEDMLAGEWSVSKPIDTHELTDAIGSAIRAGRSRVLVVGREEKQQEVGELLERRGLEYTWATSASDAARLCEEHRFEVALVDAGMRSPHVALTQLDLRGRRRRRSVVLFSTGDESPGLARLEPDPVPVEDAVQAVLTALRENAAR